MSYIDAVDKKEVSKPARYYTSPQLTNHCIGNKGMSHRQLVLGIVAATLTLATSHATSQGRKFDPYDLDRNVATEFRRDISAEPLPWPDVLDTVLHSRGKPVLEIPDSPWLRQEKRLFSDFLTRAQFDVLVVPFQVQHFGIDRTGRSLMTAELTYSLARLAQLRIPDPYLVARALGEGKRRFETAELLKFAYELGVDRVVSGFVGHDRQGHLKITIRLHTRHSGDVFYDSAFEQFDWQELPFSDTLLPAEVLRGLLPEIVEKTRLAEWKPTDRTQGGAELDLTSLGEPHTLAQQQYATVVEQAQALSLLAVLAPRGPARPPERIFERILVLLNESDGSTETARMIEARALFHLNRRPAALKQIEGIETARARGLRALLNGNLTTMAGIVAEVQSPLDRLLLSIEWNDLSFAYTGKPIGGIDKLIATTDSERWKVLIKRRFDEPDGWLNQDNSEIKRLLDKAYPVDGFSLQDLMTGQQVLGALAVDRTKIALSPLRHIRKLLTNPANKACCQPSARDAESWHYLNLLEALAASNLRGHVAKVLFVQGRVKAARRLLDSYDALYAGHPDFSLVRAQISLKQAQKMNPTEAKLLFDQSQSHSILVAYLEQGQSRVSRSALANLGIPSKHSRPFLEAYVRDFPMRSFWHPYESRVNTDENRETLNLTTALTYSAHDFQPAKHLLLYEEDASRRAGILAEIAGRFSGDPEALAVLAELNKTAGDNESLEQLYRQGIATQPGLWTHYASLGEFLIEHRADYQQAADIYLSYPGFAEDSAEKENSVGLANRAFSAGSKLFWRGQTELARSLYQLAASYPNGSHASITSAARLALLEQEFVTAAKGSLERAQRYDSVYGFRDYLSLLHALGYSDAAWSGFTQLVDRYQNPQAWASAYVGHRVNGQSLTEFLAWIDQDRIRTAAFGRVKFASGYAILWHAVDRNPSEQLLEILTKITGPPRNAVDVDGRTLLRPQDDGSRKYSIIRPSEFRREQREKFEPDTKVASGLEFFAKAYLALRQGDYAAATKGFDQLAGHYTVEAGEFSFTLPYFAFASAKAGDPLALEAFVAAIPNDRQNFDTHLARAFFAGLTDRTTAAEQHLERAFNTRPNTDSRPIFTEYQYAEACVWLFRETQHDTYRKRAVDWAKRHQRIQPTHAWAYALEAVYSQNRDERVSAAAMALYLDRGSEWLQSVPTEIMADAKARADQGNPFLNARDAENDGVGT